MTPLSEVLGQSPRMLAIREQVARFLARQAGARRIPAVLIQGETGTGKGLLARAMHAGGPRSAGPFVDLNCAALPESLLEAELFGWEPGAFTGARGAKPGLFETGHGGTVFLDEVGLLPLALQGKILTAIEDRSVRRLAATHARSIDIALVSATSVDLAAAVRDREFRADLYHRLAVLTLWLPPLRERVEDIPLLVDHYLARARAEYGLPDLTLSPAAHARLAAYSWPGNVRELSNLIERVALLADADTITPAMLNLPEDLRPRSIRASGQPGPSLEEALRERLLAALREHGGNISRTAKTLGITRNTVRKYITKWRLAEPARPPRPPEVATADPAPLPAVAPALPGPAIPDRSEPARSIPPSGDRRHLAYLLVTTALDSAAMSAMRRTIVAAGEKVRAFGGQIEERDESSILGLFGVEPIDNAPHVAGLAALAILTAAQRGQEIPGAGGDVRVALHATRARLTVGDEGPTLDPEDRAAALISLRGLAARVPDGTIATSPSAAPFLERRFALAPLGGGAQAGYRLVRRYDAPLGRALSQFVGRERPLRQLRDVLAEAEVGRGQLVAIVGDPGVGKSRLVYESTRERGDWHTLRCGAVVHGRLTSYLPFAELLKSYAKIADSDSPSEIRSKATQALLTVNNGLADAVAPLLDLLGALPDGDAFRVLDPPRRRQQTQDAIKRFLVGLAEVDPLCLVIEDLQWIDSESQACLDLIVDSLASCRFALVVTYRPEYRHTWGNKSYYTQIRLNPLESDGAERLLASLLGRKGDLSDLKRAVVARCDGNPFFIEENVRTLIETGAVAGEPGDYGAATPLGAAEIPTTVQAMLEARIDRLPADGKHLLQTASVIGKDVPLPILQSIVDMPPEALRRVLGDLEGAEFLFEKRRSPVIEYSFKHALTQEVAYSSVAGSRRALLHARIVAAVETLYADRLAEHVERLAYHAVHGEVWPSAITYLRQAATKAFNRSAHRESVAFLEDALAALARLPESRMTRLEPAIDIRLELRNSLQLLGDLEKVGRCVDELEPLVRALGDPRRLGWWSAYRGHYLWITGRATQALDFGQQATAIAEQVGDLALDVVANLYHGLACMIAGHQERADTVLRRVMAILGPDREGERFGQVGYPAVVARAYLVFSLADRGEFEEAIALGREGMRIAYALNHPYSLGLMSSNFAWLYGVKGDFKEALTLIENADAVARQGRFVLSSPRTTWYLGHLHSAAGHLTEGVALLERALREFETVGMRIYQGRVAADLAEACVRIGRLDEARIHARRAFELAEERGQRSDLAYARRALAAVAEAAGDLEAAAAHYEEALEIARELGLRPLEALCHLDLARFCGRIGHVARGAEHQALGQTMCRNMDMTFWLERTPPVA